MKLQIRVNGEWETVHEADDMEVRLVQGDTVVMPRFTASKGQGSTAIVAGTGGGAGARINRASSSEGGNGGWPGAGGNGIPLGHKSTGLAGGGQGSISVDPAEAAKANAWIKMISEQREAGQA